MSFLHRSRGGLLALLLLAGLVAIPLGCGVGGPTPEQRRIEHLEKEQQRLEGEKQTAERGKSRWQLYTLLAAVAGGLLLVVGAGMGAATLRQSGRQGKPHDHS